MPKRKHQKYNRPRKLYDAALIKEENNLMKRYGLKTRREVWRANYAIGKIRGLAKELITADESKKNEFIERQKAKGFNVNTIADVLALSKEDLLKRRLQSVVVQKGFCTTYGQSRQLIAHKHVSIKGHTIDSPSHLTTVEEEATVSANIALSTKKVITDEEKDLLKKLKGKSESSPEETEDKAEEKKE